MKRRLFLVFAIWASGLLGLSTSNAAPTLLAQYMWQGFADGPYVESFVCDPCTPPRTEEHFEITAAGNLYSHLGLTFLFGDNGDGTYGYAVPYQTVGASLDFDEGNARGFADLVERLIDTHSDNLVFFSPWGTTNDRMGEAAAFGGLLTDRGIDFLRLVVEDLSWELIDTGIRYSTRYYWQVWGKGEPLPSAAPEPATAALFCIGLAGLAFARRRKQ